jgi:hypothetical protein
MKVRFARWLSTLFIVLGVAGLFTAVGFLLLDNAEAGLPLALPGLISLGFGLAYQRMAYFTLADNRLIVPIMRGPKAVTNIPPHARLDATGSRLTMATGTQRRNLPVYRSMAHARDWVALQNMLADSQGTQAP